MTDYTRREIRKLKPELVRMIHDAARSGNTEEFIKFVQKVGNNLPIERQAEIIREFKQIAADVSGKNRRRR
jgi:hypothetical protein